MQPSIGRTVLFRMDAFHASQCNKRRNDALEHREEHRNVSNGVIVHVGNDVYAGQEYPMIIVRVWGEGPDAKVNGQVLLDGNSTLWVTSVAEGTEDGSWRWPPRVA